METGHPDAPSVAEVPLVFAAGGTLGQHLAAVDWAATLLGPPEQWPQSLVSVVRVMLSSKFSMWMAWGPELTFFCNEAYRRDTLGRKYPWALGRPANEVWAEIWPEIGPRIEHVMESGEASWEEALLLFLERSGYREETYHTFSYSPLPDDAGTIAGMLCVVAAETRGSSASAASPRCATWPASWARSGRRRRCCRPSSGRSGGTPGTFRSA
jgi:hypothetical protein